MRSSVETDPASGRKWTFDVPEPLDGDEPVTLILSLHGGGSVGAWQRGYFPAEDFADRYKVAVAIPSAATHEPFRRWVADADDAHLRAVLEAAVAQLGAHRVRAIWLAGHSQGGMTSFRLLHDPWWRERVDGWLSLSGGRFGVAEIAPDFFTPHRRPGQPAGPPPDMGGAVRPGNAVPEGLDISFIFAIGEHEILGLPERSPLAEAYGGGARERREDVVDTVPGKVFDTLRDGRSTKAWGLHPGPGHAEVYVHSTTNGRLVADVVRIGKGHTEGLEPNITEALVRMMVEAPGGRMQRLAG